MVSSSSGARVFIKDSIINLNGGGVNVQGNGVGNVASIFSTLIDRNTSFAVQANGVGNILGVVSSVLNVSATEINLLNGASAVFRAEKRRFGRWCTRLDKSVQISQCSRGVTACGSNLSGPPRSAKIKLCLRSSFFCGYDEQHRPKLLKCRPMTASRRIVSVIRE